MTVRDVWADESQDFTPWLAGNLHKLGGALDLKLELVEQEAAVGCFSLDILARETDRGVMVAIENQLEWTDNSHLGQLLTYAAWYDARVLVWVTPRFHDVHLDALAWFQRWLPEGVQVYGIEIRRPRRTADGTPDCDLVKVDPSDASARRPVDDGLNPRSRQYRDFFQPVIDAFWTSGFATDRSYALARSDQPFASGLDGVTYHASLEGSGACVYLWISTGDRNRNSAIFEALRAHEAEIARELQGADVRWIGQPGNRVPASMGMVMEGAAIDDPPENLALTQAWMIDALPTFKAAIHPRLEAILHRRPPT